MLPKVSIVVPIFKVECYLHRCVDSILNQTYKNIEVILVDDGSPDKCGEIIEQYKKQDIRVISLHKENGGLSDARNYGVKYITGEYTIFLDSDDWLEKDFISTLIDLAIKSNADVVQSGFYYAYKDHLLYDDRYYSENSELVFLDNKNLMKELVINERVKNFAWGKLYKTELIKNIPFEKGVLFEDVFWAHKVMQKVDKYLIMHKPMCYYTQREDSIVSNYTVRNLDIIKGLKERHKFIEKYYSDLRNESYKILLNTCLIHYNLLIKNKEKDINGLHKKELENFINDNFENFNRAVVNNKILKRRLHLFKIMPTLNLCPLMVKKVLEKSNLLKSEKKLKCIKM